MYFRRLKSRSEILRLLLGGRVTLIGSVKSEVELWEGLTVPWVV